MIGLMFFDFQMISVAEIAFFDYNRIRSFQSKFILSLFLSMIMLSLILFEFLKGLVLIYKKSKEIETSNSLKREEKKDVLDQEEQVRDGEDSEEEAGESPNNQMILEKYTEVIDMSIGGPLAAKMVFIVGDIRFFVVQVVISSLQHLNRTQSSIVLSINGCYLIYFIRVLFGGKVFSSKLMLVKEIAQEVSIMVLISTITVFSFTEKSDFNSSKTYKAMEFLAIFSIIGVCAGEFVILLTDLFTTLRASCKRKPKKKIERKEIIDKVGVFELDSPEEDELKNSKKLNKKRSRINSNLALFGKGSKKSRISSTGDCRKEWFESEQSLQKQKNQRERNERDRLELFKGGEFFKTGRVKQNYDKVGEGGLNRQINITVQKKAKKRVNRTRKGFGKQKNVKYSQNDQWNFEEKK